MGRIIRKVIQKRLNSEGRKQYIFDSSSSKENIPEKKKQPVLNRKIQNVAVARKFLPEDVVKKVKTVIRSNTRFQNRINKSIDKSQIGKLTKSQSPTFDPNYIIKDFGEYVKVKDVDYDVVIALSSYNRFAKIKNILNQLFSQKTKYTFKVILMNDGSTKGNYENLLYEFPEIEYIQNEKNGGKIYYWRTLNRLWSQVSKYKIHAMCQMDDDFHLCDKFIDNLMDKFFEVKDKNNSYMAFRYHIGELWSGSVGDSYVNHEDRFRGVDGGTLYDVQFLRMINYEHKVVKGLTPNSDSRVWMNMNNSIIYNGVKVFWFDNSLAYHIGNNDSKLNPIVRKNRKIHTRNYIDGKE